MPSSKRSKPESWNLVNADYNKQEPLQKLDGGELILHLHVEMDSVPKERSIPDDVQTTYDALKKKFGASSTLKTKEGALRFTILNVKSVEEVFRFLKNQLGFTWNKGSSLSDKDGEILRKPSSGVESPLDFKIREEEGEFNCVLEKRRGARTQK